MKRSFKFFSFWLFLVLGTATIIFNSCGSFLKNKSTNDEGVIINGVKWATRNVDKPGTFAANPEDAGMFYQWNCKKAWATTGTVKGWDSSNPTGNTWKKANDPSPKGWRVPTCEELQKLLDTKKVSSEWITQNGVVGRKFTDIATGDTLFLPAAGYRYYIDSMLEYVGMDGIYWSSMAHESNEALAYGMYFINDHASRLSFYCSHGFSVRSVAE